MRPNHGRRTKVATGVSRTEDRSLPQRYLSPTELADLLGIPVETVYQWRYKRTGPPAFRVGRHLRYDPRAVLGWIDSLGDEVA
jgi:excisionase family DNA binding protein